LTFQAFCDKIEVWGLFFGVFIKIARKLSKKEVLLMKKATQRLISAPHLGVNAKLEQNRKVTQCLTLAQSLRILALCLGITTILSGCQQSATDSAKAPAQETTKETVPDAPFNTSENRAWGDEGSFLRMADLSSKTEGTEELLVSDFSSGEVKLSDEREYAAVVYLRNASDEVQKDIAITLRHDDVLQAGTKNQLDALITWGGADAGVIADALQLHPTVDLGLCPADNDSGTSVAIIRQGNGELSKTPLLNVSLDGVTTHMATLSEIPVGETYLVFFMFEALPATR